MPELPEVETVKRGLERTIVGKRIVAIEIRHKKTFADDDKLIRRVLIEARVAAVARRAKVLLIELSTDWVLAIHLKMTGQLVVLPHHDRGFVGGHPEKVYETGLPNKHTQVMLRFHDKTKLYFNDLRKFGWLKLFPRNNQIKSQISEIKMINQNSKVPTIEEFLVVLQLGPEPLSTEFTQAYLAKLVRGRSIPIKQLLLEQKGISGIGNIYADEALFRAGIRPIRKAIGLKKLEIRKLHQAIRDVLELGIKFGGTSKNTYLQVEGTKGEMQDHLMVYGREGLPCRVCGTPIERMKIGQRSARYCPKCQK